MRWPVPFKEIRGKVCPNEPLSKHTSLKIGGPAEFWIEPEDIEDLKKTLAICKAEHIPVQVFGAGSNLLAPDEGLKGAVVHAGDAFFRRLEEEAGLIRAGAGTPNTLFIQYAIGRGYGGCEFLTGIPGNIGGAIAMNAGSHNHSIEEILEGVRVVDFEGREQLLTKNQIPFRYRSAGLREMFIVEGIFRLPQVPRAQTQKTLEEYRDYRQKTQDLHYPSAGCMFKNPSTPGCSSGKLIDETGLKGKRVGNAQVSLKHGNFIINLGGAKASDVKHLIEEVQSEVRKKTGVILETEVKIL